MIFQSGQKVICIDADNNPALIKGQQYTISKFLVGRNGSACMLVETGDDRFFSYRFQTQELAHMKKHKYELGREPKESGTAADVKGVPHVDGRHPHMRGPHHEMGEYHDGSHHHEHHRGKKD